jgi:hypothetical protein
VKVKMKMNWSKVRFGRYVWIIVSKKKLKKE